MTIMKSDTSHVSIAENLQELIDAKADMKSAIESKGVEVTGGLSTYADAIREIETGDIRSEYDGISFTGSRFREPPYFDTSWMTDMSGMFFDCNFIVIVPHYDTSNVTDMHGMFGSCEDLTTVPQFDTSKVTNMRDMFDGDWALKSVPLLDTSKVTNISGMFINCSSLTDVGGFKNLGMQPTLITTDMFGNDNLGRARYLTHDSIMNIINNLYDRKSAGYSVVTLPFSSANLGRISDEEKAIATNKGWILS